MICGLRFCYCDAYLWCSIRHVCNFLGWDNKVILNLKSWPTFFFSFFFFFWSLTDVGGNCSSGQICDNCAVKISSDVSESPHATPGILNFCCQDCGLVMPYLHRDDDVCHCVGDPQGKVTADWVHCWLGSLLTGWLVVQSCIHSLECTGCQKGSTKQKAVVVVVVVVFSGRW